MSLYIFIIATHATEFVVGSTLDASSWTRDDFKHPSNWVGPTGKCELGRNQSPINIRPKLTKKVTDADPFIFHGYNKRGHTSLTNNGHTVKFQFTKGPHKMPWIQGGGLDKYKYQFEQGHFHWGNDSHKGSEHNVDYREAPMELHLVHFNRHFYRNLEEASSLETNPSENISIVNLAVLFKIGSANIKLDSLV